MTDQTVASDQEKPDATPKAVVEGSTEAVDAQEETLESILEEVTPDDFKPDPKEETTADENMKKVLAFVEDQQNKEIQSSVKADLNAAVEQMGEYSEAVKALPAKLRHGYLLAVAEENPRLLTAFTKRGDDPATWNRAVSGLAKEIDKLIADQPDAQLTSDRVAALASVRGVSNTAPTSEAKTPAEIRAMTDAEIDAYNASGGRT